MKLLFINAFKGLRKKKIQMFGIAMLVLLSIGVYVGMNSAMDRLEDEYYGYLDKQNVEDVSAGVNIDYAKISIDELNNIINKYLTNMTNEEKLVIDSYKEYLKNNPVYSLQIIYSVKPIFDKYGVTSVLEKDIIDKMAIKYDFSYELEKSKTVTEDKLLMKFLVYNESNKINKIYLIDGKLPKEDNEITILPNYAKENNLEIGDNLKIGDTTYKIVGFAYAPDYVYPLISFSMPIFDEKNNNISYTNEATYEKVNGVNDNSYAIKYNYKTDRQFKFNGDMKNKVFKVFDDESKSLVADMNTITRLSRISALQLEFSSDRLFADYFMYVLLSISILIIIVVTKKRIDDERLQIGVLKSLGYNRFSIATSYLVYPVVGSVIGGILGFLVGLLVQSPIAKVLLSFYNVPLANFSIDMHYLLNSILTPMISLSILSYLIAIIMLRKKPLSLLREGSNLKVNLFSKLVNKITSLLPFDYRFKYSLAFRSIGKLLIVSITSFCTGLLIVLVLVSYNLFNNMIEKSFAGINYKYMVIVNGVLEKEEGDYKDDYVLETNIPLSKIISNGKERTVEEDTNIQVTGLDLNSNYVEILDENKKNIINRLEDKEGIIVSESTKELLDLKEGDKLLFEFEGIKVEYNIVGFSKEYMGYRGYAIRSGLSEKAGFNNNVYSVIYSSDNKYSNLSKMSKEESKDIYNIISLSDLKENIMKQMDRFNGSIYIVIGFASVMALIIIAVIANIVVEENKKTISLMKVMGYKNKRISNIVLNIYTPFVVVAYLLAIPVMLKILKVIVNALVGDIEVVIPIEISPFMAILGLVGLVVAYYLAIALSKRVLNKIPLAIALKRE